MPIIGVMAQIEKIHGSRTPTRLHYLPQWAEKRGLIQADIARDLGVDKGTVSRWFDGYLPKEQSIPPLCALLQIEPNALFRHPDDDWLSRLFTGRDDEEKTRILAMIEAAFPRKVG